MIYNRDVSRIVRKALMVNIAEKRRIINAIADKRIAPGKDPLRASAALLPI
jgi:hypothetical protein